MIALQSHLLILFARFSGFIPFLHVKSKVTPLDRFQLLLGGGVIPHITDTPRCILVLLFLPGTLK